MNKRWEPKFPFPVSDSKEMKLTREIHTNEYQSNMKYLQTNIFIEKDVPKRKQVIKCIEDAYMNIPI